MPKTKFESVIFTAVTAWIMVYIMTLYNTVLATGSFTNSTFLLVLKEMWFEYVVIFLCAYFISGHVAKYFAFRVVTPGDRPIAIIFAIQIFTVVCQVALASILGMYHAYDFTSQWLPNYLMTYCRNFVMALPVQLLIAGPIADRPRTLPRCLPPWRSSCSGQGIIFHPILKGAKSTLDSAPFKICVFTS